MTDALTAFLRARFDKDAQVAHDASGFTVLEASGQWIKSPFGDEWEATRSDCEEDELLVALRPGLPRPPEELSGLWGSIVSDTPSLSQQSGSASVRPQLVHAARHDPARVLAEIDAKRRLVEDMAAVVAGEYVDAGEPVLAERVLLLLALPYASHPDYLQEWAP